VGLFDWLGRGRGGARQAAPPQPTWQVRREGDELVVQEGHGAPSRLALSGMRSVRIVPLTGGNHHVGPGGGAWQVALARAEGDVLVGSALADWQSARELARLVCEQSGLPLDELTERMFSRVGTFPPRSRVQDR
jgi:hypothetical protein